MEGMTLSIIVGVVGLAAGTGAGYFLFNSLLTRKKEASIKEAEEKAETLKQKKILQAKEKFLEMKEEHEKNVKSRTSKLAQAENKANQLQ